VQHVVICGPPNTGKTTYSKRLARPQDLVWDWDAVVAAMMPAREPSAAPDIPMLPFAVLTTLRLDFVRILADYPASECRAIVTLVNKHEAERIAGILNAELIELPR
jgi:hypothetical protein